MKLYIQIKNGIAINHPALEQNLLQVFNTIPEDWAPFNRVLQPSNDELPVGLYQVPVCTYVLADDGISWQDQWTVRDMTEEEKIEKINRVLDTKPFPSWIFDETTCSFISPIPYPNDGKLYVWNEQKIEWKEVINT